MNRGADAAGGRSLRILHVLAPAQFGGLERVVRMLVRGQLAVGVDAQVAAIVEAGGGTDPSFTREASALGAPVHVVEVGHRQYVRERRRVAGLYRSLEPDAVHLHGYRPDVLHSGTARRLGVPQITTVHGFTGGDAKNRFYERLQRRSFRRMDAVVAVSAPLAEELAAGGVRPHRVHCVANAWEGYDEPVPRAAARDRLGIPEDGFHIGFVGRLTREKGPDILLEAMPRLRDLPVTLSFIGTGREETTLQDRAARLGIGDRVRWHGMVPDAGRYLGAFDLLVISSRTEGTPIILFEAMEAEVPVVAASVGGIPHVVSPDEAALVPPEDPLLLAAAIRAVLDDPAAAALRARRARRRLRGEYGIEDWVARYSAIYESVIQASGRGDDR